MDPSSHVMVSYIVYMYVYQTLYTATKLSLFCPVTNIYRIIGAAIMLSVTTVMCAANYQSSVNLEDSIQLKLTNYSHSANKMHN